jgi:ABC-type transport system substrate-binding protein
MKQYARGQLIELERNPDLRAGRPYLDGIRYTIISERGTARRPSDRPR